MSLFLGTFADLTGYRINNFMIEGLSGRDVSGAPFWRVVHQAAGCNYPQSLPHSRIAALVQGRHSQISLLCANPACPLSHRESQSETIDEFRRRERREAEQAARAAAEAKREADAKAETDRRQAARDAEIQRTYIRYLNAQWRAGQDDDTICSRRRWFELTPGTREIVMDLIEKDPMVRIGGL
jgi:hypothetical protein